MLAPYPLKPMTESAPKIGTPSGSRILKLEIKCFRGVKHLVWCPAPGVNVLIGGGDVGKTTILEAIALLLSPSNQGSLTDFDFYDRDQSSGFSVEAVISLPPDVAAQLGRSNWPWAWDGTNAVVPSDVADSSATEPVYRIRVCANEELELVHEIILPSTEGANLSYSTRRAIGLVRLSTDDRNDRDLRLVQGSALDRLLTDKGLRSRITNTLVQADVAQQLDDEKAKALSDLDDSFKDRQLPASLSIAITGGAGPSIASMVGLTASQREIRLPLSSWGAGTRRLASLAISEKTQGNSPVIVVDEAERGLEPYRQRLLLEGLATRSSQAFATTHSPFVIKACEQAVLWHMDRNGRLGRLDGEKLHDILSGEPAAFLARLTLVAEGPTEVGFATALLERVLGKQLDYFGIYVANGGGNDRAIAALQAIQSAGFRFGAFIDNEGRSAGKWSRIKQAIGGLGFQWKTGSTESNVISAVPDDKLEEFVNDPLNDLTEFRLGSLRQRLDLVRADWKAIKATANERSLDIRAVMVAAATGQVPTGKDAEKKRYQRHARAWFKSGDGSGGRELEHKLFALNIWNTLEPVLLPFCTAVCEEVGANPTNNWT